MTIHEFGKENTKTIVLLHPSAVMWDFFQWVIPLLETEYRLIVPAIPGYDKETQNDFTSVEEIVSELADWLIDNGMHEVECVYGCSMGGAIVTHMLVEKRIKINHAIVDGGITPYQLPWVITRLIAVRDFLMISMGKFGGLKLLEKAFSTEEYSKEDLKYIADVIQMMSYKTIWRTFESCNNYSMPKNIQTSCRHIAYWYGEKEIKDRKWDLQYYKKNFPETKIIMIPGLGHAALAGTKPELFAEMLREEVLR